MARALILQSIGKQRKAQNLPGQESFRFWLRSSTPPFPELCNKCAKSQKKMQKCRLLFGWYSVRLDSGKIFFVLFGFEHIFLLTPPQRITSLKLPIYSKEILHLEDFI